MLGYDAYVDPHACLCCCCLPMLINMIAHFRSCFGASSAMFSKYHSSLLPVNMLHACSLTLTWAWDPMRVTLKENMHFGFLHEHLIYYWPRIVLIFNWAYYKLFSPTQKYPWIIQSAYFHAAIFFSLRTWISLVNDFI